MFRILIVDDERIILNGCSMMINQLLCFHFPVETYVADSVDAAKTILGKISIDLALVDIRMPGHDGFELASFVNDMEQPPDFVVLTSHANFDYAQQGIRLGVRDFLLKPVDEKQLQDVIIASHARKQRREEALFRSQYLDLLTMLRYDLSSSDLMMSRQNISRIFPMSKFQVVVLQFTDCLPKNMDFDKVLETYCPTVHCFELRDLAQVACVCNFAEPENLNGDPETLLDSMFSGTCEIVASAITGRFDDLHRLYVDTQQKLFYRRVFGRTATDNIPLCRQADCLRVLFAPSEEEIHTAAKTLLEQLEIAENASLETLSIVLESYRQNLLLYFADTQLNHPKVLEKRASASPASVSELFRAIVELTLSVRKDLQDKDTDAKESTLISQVLDYINTHYMEDLSLDNLAETANLHPNYICTLFRRLTGNSYLYFLHQARIHAAKTLLIQSDDTMESIAEKTGYNSTTQFTRVFRKYERTTPAEYRRLNR